MGQNARKYCDVNYDGPGLNSAKNNDAKIGNDFHKQAPLCWKPSPNFPELTSRLFPISSS